MQFYSHYQKGKYCRVKEAPMIVIDFHRLNLKPEQTIADSKLRNKGGNKFNDLFVTSGSLICKSNDKVLVAHTNTHNFRILVDSYSNNLKMGWQDSSIVCNARINKIMPGNIKHNNNIPDWAGFHLFGRYQTENDLYVASVRLDGNVAIKKKKNGEYTTLAIKTLNVCRVGDIFQMEFNITTNSKGHVMLTIYVDRNQVLIAEDKLNVIEWGTNGIRIDYCESDIFSISINKI